MWTPACVMIPVEVAVAEIRGEIPSGTTAAIALMLRYPTTSREAMQGKYPTFAIPFGIADAFLRTEQIVTADGEMIAEPTATEVASPADNGSNLPTVEPQWGTLTEADIKSKIAEVFPKNPSVSEFQITQIQELTQSDPEFFNNAVELASQSRTVIKHPASYVITILKAETRGTVAEKVEANRKQAEYDTGAFVNQVLRKAEQTLAKLPKPQVTPESLDELDALLGELHG